MLGQHQNVDRARFLLEALGENPLPWDLFRFPWLVVTFFTFKASNVRLSLSRAATSLVLPSASLFFKDPGDYSEPNWIIRDYLPFSIR